MVQERERDLTPVGTLDLSVHARTSRSSSLLEGCVPIRTAPCTPWCLDEIGERENRVRTRLSDSVASVSRFPNRATYANRAIEYRVAGTFQPLQF